MTEVEKILRHPVTWVVGAVTSVIGVMAAFALNPVHVAATVVEVAFANASTIFTASSIAGFTLAPAMFPPLAATAVKGVAFGSGILVVAKIGDRMWDRFKERLDDD